MIDSELERIENKRREGFCFKPQEIHHEANYAFEPIQVVALAATQLSIFGLAGAHSNNTNLSVPVTFVPQGNTSFDTLKQIDAGVLNVGYAEAGPSDGPAVLLLHGWPYDIHSFVDVAPMLANAG